MGNAIDILACPREQLCDHTCTERAVSLRVILAASVKRSGTQLQQRLPVGTQSRHLAASASPQHHRQGPTAGVARGISARSRIRRSDHQLHILLPCANGWGRERIAVLRRCCWRVAALGPTGGSYISRRLRHDRFAKPDARRDHAVMPRSWIVRRWFQRAESLVCRLARHSSGVMIRMR